VNAAERNARQRTRKLFLTGITCVTFCCRRSSAANGQTENQMNGRLTIQGFLGLRTAIYHAPDLAKGKAWYSKSSHLPYFDQPFYIGFNVGGYELGLDPDPSSSTGSGGVLSIGASPTRMRR